MLIAAQEDSQTFEINAGEVLTGATFTANGEYLVGSGYRSVQVWRVKDGERVATMKVENPGVFSVAVSKDGRYIAAESYYEVLVWDTAKYERVFAAKPGRGVWGVDFSPDSTRLLTAGGWNSTATIWDIGARQKVRKLDHDKVVHATKYSPEGDRIATAGPGSIRVWDSNDGRLLLNVQVERIHSRGLLWSSNHLFVATGDEIQQVDASTGSTLSEWSVPASYTASIALPHHEKFVTYATKDNVTFWDTTTHTKLGHIPGYFIAFSPSDQLLAIIQRRKIIIRRRSSLIKGPEIQIDNAILDAWKHNQLADTEALLTAAIPTSTDTAHHLLASRALVWARLLQWDAALADAEESIDIQSSVVGYIAKCVALVGKGDKNAGCRVFDITPLCFHSEDVGILLLVKAVVLFMAGEHDDAIARMDDLFHIAYHNLELCVVQAYMHLLLGNSHMDSGDYECAIQSFNQARVKLGRVGINLGDQQISGWKFDDLAITIQRQLCEALLSAGRTIEAGDSIRRMVYRMVDMTEAIEIWASEFLHRCLSAPERDDDVDSAITCRDNASHAYTPLLREWARLRLATEPWKDVLASATNFVSPKFTIYQVICEHLETTGNIADAVSCFQHMCNGLAEEMDSDALIWTRAFKSRCLDKLEDLGDIATKNEEYDTAISYYTTALSLGPTNTQDLLIKRSTARTENGKWDDALTDANEVISLDPDSPSGYEKRHAALHRKGDHNNAICAYETMLLKMSGSSDPKIRKRFHHYVPPGKKKAAIHATIEHTTRTSPPVLIDTIHGRLCDKSEQASTFEQSPSFAELVSSITTHIDHANIEQEVQKYFRYATFSHKWEDNEPLFEKVIRIMVFDLEASPAHEKLQMFCKIVREAGFNWAWSDTCCINKGDHVVLQEALVSMFRWYQSSAMTIIFLRGVDRLAKRGALTRNIWNMRAWTLQEYHASKVVRIYTEDWTPYLGLEIYNYKESPEIISEMEEATGLSAQALMGLHPGLNNIREKLQLASTRQTTRVEDAAYSLLGIFSLSLPVTYGEGDKTLGRLLAQLLASSGDTSILAWSGDSGSFNSCLPFSITVFRDSPTSHIPPAVVRAEMGTAGIRPPHLALLTKLYDQVDGLPLPSFSGLRMNLPCLAFKLGPVLVSRNRLGLVFRAQTHGLGIVEIQTQVDLSKLGTLYLVHPWIDFLLDRQPVGSVTDTRLAENIDDDRFSVLRDLPSSSNAIPPAIQTRAARLVARLGKPFGGRSDPDTTSLLPPSTVSPSEKQTRVLQFIARLRRPFGALLLTPTRRNVEEYRRVAAESLITVQVEEITPAVLDKLIQGARLLHVL